MLELDLAVNNVDLGFFGSFHVEAPDAEFAARIRQQCLGSVDDHGSGSLLLGMAGQGGEEQEAVNKYFAEVVHSFVALLLAGLVNNC